jgi:chromosome segregation ATPase
MEAKKARHTQKEELKSLVIELEELDRSYEALRDRLSALDIQMVEIRSRGEGAKERIEDLEAGDWPRVDPVILKGEEQQLKDLVSSREKAGQEAQQQLEKQRVLLEERTQQLTAEASEVDDREIKIRHELQKAGLEVPEDLESLFGEVFQKERAKAEVEKFTRDQQQLEKPDGEPRARWFSGHRRSLGGAPGGAGGACQGQGPKGRGARRLGQTRSRLARAEGSA